ncbi:hypothetical protein LB823_02700 [Tsukamurella sp. M9C]|uniref:hypothetical protein n=1 Tax=Tsukamurella sp. M9C TaxID=2877520 RepID=UPI001CCA3F15|nr:hypothetical protein [Tsukamurella sp. M9C]MCA0155103.1 hypothetical protein [Tsukamurella sp. M9C]
MDGAGRCAGAPPSAWRKYRERRSRHSVLDAPIGAEDEGVDVALPAVPAQGGIRLICRPGDSAMPGVAYESGVDLGVFVDGVARTSNWGESILPVTAGDHALGMELNGYVTQHLGPVRTIRFGAANLPIRVAPGQTVTVFYAAPNGPRSPGQFSFSPPPPPAANRYRVAQVVGWWILAGVVLLTFVVIAYLAATKS